MLLNAQNGILHMDGTVMEYIRFGSGPRTLVMLPGLGDGLRTMKGTALPMAVMYREFAKEFTVYAFSRKSVLPQGYTTCQMAHDQAEAMKQLGIEKADVLGVSMGGMIGQHLAAEYPTKINKLILTVTSSKPNEILTESVREWVACARQDDHTALMASNLRRIYSPEYCRKNQWMVPLLGKLTKPKSYDRFFVQADACVSHNAYDKLHLIQAPTLVIGGEKDLALGGDASAELAERIPNAALYMYPQQGHGLYEEAPDFNHRIKSFFLK